VTLVRTEVSEERIASMFRVERIGEEITMLAATYNLRTSRRKTDHIRKEAIESTAIIVPGSLFLFTLMMEAIHSSETSVLTRTTRSHIAENGILHSHRRENLKSYIALTG
jgi:UDP-N-acetylglucosamine 2-epimerase